MEPSRLTFLSEKDNRRWEEIGGWLLPSAADALYRYTSQASPQGAVVEIGSFAGKSTVCIARALKDNRPDTGRLFAIDIKFQSDFRKNLADLGVSELVQFFERSSLDVAETWRQPISFLYIDAHHGKAHAYADLMVWDMMVIQGGIVGLDDTIGFMMGPNLQMQAALGTGAYEVLSETGGVSFLKKKHAILPAISDFPLSRGSLIGYVHYVSAWLGAMDPGFRLPQPPHSPRRQSLLLRRAQQVRSLFGEIWKTSPHQVASYVAKALAFRKERQHSPNVETGEETCRDDRVPMQLQRVLEWLEKQCDADQATTSTLSYFRACLEIRLSCAESAIEKLRILSELDGTWQFLHYRISIREMALLRLAQARDLQGERELAVGGYAALRKESAIPELQRQAEIGLGTAFRLPAVSRRLLLREYNLELDEYRTTAPAK